MGGFYLDIIKDRLYTVHPQAPARRSAQSAMYHIIQALVRWIAPILSFTAEEIYKSLPGTKLKSVFLSEWYDGLFDLSENELPNMSEWNQILGLRDVVNKQIENIRQTGTIGSSLDAEIKLYCDGNDYRLLKQLDRELKFLFITSAAEVFPSAQAGRRFRTNLGAYEDRYIPPASILNVLVVGNTVTILRDPIMVRYVRAAC